jgi:uncharacterized protein CbrC (UPF0167 family)
LSEANGEKGSSVSAVVMLLKMLAQNILGSAQTMPAFTQWLQDEWISCQILSRTFLGNKLNNLFLDTAADEDLF